MEIKSIEDGNSNFELVELRDDGNIGKLTPYCKRHGAMLKVSEFGYWRCVQSEPNKDYQYLWTNELEKDCRAGCIEVKIMLSERVEAKPQLTQEG